MINIFTSRCQFSASVTAEEIIPLYAKSCKTVGTRNVPTVTVFLLENVGRENESLSTRHVSTLEAKLETKAVNHAEWIFLCKCRERRGEFKNWIKFRGFISTVATIESNKNTPSYFITLQLINKALHGCFQWECSLRGAHWNSTTWCSTQTSGNVFVNTSRQKKKLPGYRKFKVITQHSTEAAEAERCRICRNANFWNF